MKTQEELEQEIVGAIKEWRLFEQSKQERILKYGKMEDNEQ